MKKVFLFAAILAIAASCTVSEIDSIKGTTAPEIIASYEKGLAKTTITTDEEGVGTIWWKPADEINVFYGTLSVHYTSKNKENATTVAFGTTDIIGSTESASENIWGLYPYNEDAECDGESVTTTIPATQQAIAGSFNDDLFTSLAHSTSTVMTFYNVLGGIKFSLSRDDIQTITFKGNNDEDIAGKVSLSMDANGKPVAEIVEGEKTITLTPKEGTTFAKNTNYYIVLLPTVLSKGFTMTFETETAIGTFEYTTKSIEIKRSVFSKKENIDTYANFEDKQVQATDLSAAGTANCYIVSSSGKYKFKTVQGNSNTSVGDVKGIKVLWESFGTNVAPTIGDLIKPDVSYADNYITFSTNDTYTEGNAVIAAYSDANCTDGNVLWSWHIWLTDVPEEQVYNNNAGTMMDRNLGATSATPGDVHTLGLLYQWGRKDPFLNASGINPSVDFIQEQAKSTYDWPAVKELSEDILNNGTALSFSICYPTVVITSNNRVSDWFCITENHQDNALWSSEKTIYDPCPDGWTVPKGGDGDYCLNDANDGVWYIALNHSSTTPSTVDNPNKTNSGFNFGNNNRFGMYDTIWYPLSGELSNTNNSERAGHICKVGDYGYLWSSTSTKAFDVGYGSKTFEFYGIGTMFYYQTYHNSRSKGASVRCQKIQ